MPTTPSARPSYVFDQTLSPGISGRTESTTFGDGLSAFVPLWAVAALFSIAGDYAGLVGHKGWFYAVPGWAIFAHSLWLIARPRDTAVLMSLAATTVFIYALRSPVASNNQTITMVMNSAILVTGGVLFLRSRAAIDRTALYEQIRVVARALLAIMYFFGIFHKINTDFLDPTVSCAVGLYVPLARPFGLEDNLFGRYVAIYATFIVEALAIVALYWRRFFAVGLILALVFHYVIPISAYSWYMDFSSLVFALYMLSIPRPVSAMAQRSIASILGPSHAVCGPFGTLALGLAFLVTMAAGVVVVLSFFNPGQSEALLRHSSAILIWSIVGGGLMIVLSHAALHHLPYTGPHAPRQPAWLYIIPGIFFLTCWSPYVGLKTESSINMFSNLHTEAGETNHLLFDKPPYLFDYQEDVVKVLDSSIASLRRQAESGQQHILFALEETLRQNPQEWVTYDLRGQRFEQVTAADLGRAPTLLERKLLRFKLVDFNRPKVCTH